MKTLIYALLFTISIQSIIKLSNHKPAIPESKKIEIRLPPVGQITPIEIKSKNIITNVDTNGHTINATGADGETVVGKQYHEGYNKTFDPSTIIYKDQPIDR